MQRPQNRCLSSGKMDWHQKWRHTNWPNFDKFIMQKFLVLCSLDQGHKLGKRGLPRHLNGPIKLQFAGLCIFMSNVKVFALKDNFEWDFDSFIKNGWALLHYILQSHKRSPHFIARVTSLMNVPCFIPS